MAYRSTSYPCFDVGRRGLLSPNKAVTSIDLLLCAIPADCGYSNLYCASNIRAKLTTALLGVWKGRRRLRLGLSWF